MVLVNMAMWPRRHVHRFFGREQVEWVFFVGKRVHSAKGTSRGLSSCRVGRVNVIIKDLYTRRLGRVYRQHPAVVDIHIYIYIYIYRSL